MDLLNALQHTLTKYYPSMSSKSKMQIGQLCTIKRIGKNELLLEEGKRNDCEYFLLEGVMRSFLSTSKGKEITISFFDNGSILSPALTRTRNGSALLNFQALSDVKVAEMHADEFEVLIEQNLEVRDFANTVLRIELMEKVQKEIRMASWTAKERLEQFRKDYKHLENIVPHHMVASYLGITNVSLSRLRGQR